MIPLSVTPNIEFPDGRRFTAQTTLALLNGAMIAFRASAEMEGEELPQARTS